MIDRDLLIAAGWTPPIDTTGYEEWRPALVVYRKTYDGPSVAFTMDRIDREAIEMLRMVVRAAPTSALIEALAARGQEGPAT